MTRFFVIGVLSLSIILCWKQDSNSPGAQTKEARYAVAVLPVPVLNTPDFSSVFGGRDGKTLRLGKNNLIEEVEFIALPQTVFVIEQTIKKNNHEILKVRTEDYPYQKQKGYYIDSRFVEKKTEKPNGRIRRLPDRNTIINNLISAKGAIYVWGGNYIKGVSQMLEFYKPSGELSKDIQNRWALRGVDCSGLLYEATSGYTPRNVESLFYFGSPVNIEGLSPDEIVKRLKPLDIIVYQRHVIMVLNRSEAIESSITVGVRIRSLANVIEILSRSLRPANTYESGDEDKFVVRRWYQH